ncbi:HAD-like protein, partial [Cylindrobasidium torrendii FP15055 ss-10]
MASKAPKRSAKQTPPPPPQQPPAESAPLQANFPNLDIIPPEEEVPTGRTGARSSADSPLSVDDKRKNMRWVSFGMLTGVMGLALVYASREWDEEEMKAKKWTLETAPSARWERAVTRLKDFFGLFSDPPAPELLPPAVPPPHGKPYTLVLEIDDLLVTSTWDRQHGWRTAKRPGVDYFLAYLSQFYEIVIFSRQYQYTADPILFQLDKFQFFINHRLYRESMRLMGGQTVKDLSYLNRDLSKVVLLDTIPEHGAAQPENAVIVPPWKGAPNDRNLIAMIPFLESLAIYKVPDVRPIIKAYEGKDIPIEYAKKEAEAKQKHIEEWAEKKRQPGLFSIARDNSTPPTYLEARRKEAQQFYRDEQAYIARNKANLDKLLQEEQDAMMAQSPAPGNLWEMIDMMKNGPPPPG